MTQIQFNLIIINLQLIMSLMIHIIATLQLTSRPIWIILYLRNFILFICGIQLIVVIILSIFNYK